MPNVTLNQFTGLNEQQPSFTRGETVAVADTVAWVHGKHNLRFGGDFRRVYDDMIGNTNSTGTFVFTGLFTEAPGSGTAGNSGFNGFASSGSSLADMLLGLPRKPPCRPPTRKRISVRTRWTVMRRTTGAR